MTKATTKEIQTFQELCIELAELCTKLPVTKELNTNVLGKVLKNKEYQILRKYMPVTKRPKGKFRNLVLILIDQIPIIPNTDELEETLVNLNIVYHYLFKRDSTLDNYFSGDIRTKMTKTHGYDSVPHKLSLEITKLSWKRKGDLLRAQAEKTYAKNKNTHVVKHSEILSMIKESLESDNIFKRSLALLIASGCRPIEFFNRSEFEVAETPSGWLLQHGIAKKRGNDPIKTVLKPLILITPQKFIEEWTSIKTQLAERYKSLKSATIKTDKLSASISKNINEVAKVVFKQFETDTEEPTAYDSRALYANLSFELYGRGKQSIVGNAPTLDVWVSEVLGHKAGTQDTSKHYTRYTVVMDLETNKLKETISNLKEKLKDCSEDKTDNRNIIKKMYENLSKLDSKPPSQNKLEQSLRGIVIRREVREWFTNFKDSKP